MGIFKAYGRNVSSVFQLMGNKENDITKSIAWVLYNCSAFMENMVKEIFHIDINPNAVEMYYQKYDLETGITDLEITDHKNFYIIIEAKRGWILPGSTQLTSYSERRDFREAVTIPNKAIVTMSECSSEYAEDHLPFAEVNGIPIKHLSWSKVENLAKNARNQADNRGKHLLQELVEYMGGIKTMQDRNTNMVYVVSLGSGRPQNCAITWIDIVKKRNVYFHPVGNRWPYEPVNYVAFRYGGQLQSIHHVDGYVVSVNLHEQVEDMPDVSQKENHFVYKLGPAIVPSKIVKTGKSIRMARRVWAMIDLLLTSDTIEEAVEKTKLRGIEIRE